MKSFFFEMLLRMILLAMAITGGILLGLLIIELTRG